MSDATSERQEQEGLFHHAAQALEWPRVLDLVASRAQSAMGAERCKALRLETELDAARLRLQETLVMLRLEESGVPFPSLGFSDGREVLTRAVKSATLDGTELRDLSNTLNCGMVIHRFLALHRMETAALGVVATPLDGVSRVIVLKEAIDRCVDGEGHIRESATPELRRLSRHAQDLKQTMRGRLEAILASTRYTDVLQERYFDQREGRYVVPLKAEMRGRIPGIVHDVSASGATVFLEPRELVDLNNAIKVAGLAVQREIGRILHDLSGQVADQAETILAIMEALATLDSIAAKAAFSARIKGQMIQLNTTGRIALYQARHPLLLFARSPEAVVANDIVMDESVRVLVISGPNTGGKTVTLKIMGLYALMVRTGLLPSCTSDSEMPLFTHIYADVGDTQDLAKDLSSFSAHMTQIIRMIRLVQPHRPPMDRPASTSPATLVLLDELATSTDPTEGAALAEALLKHLAALHLKVVVTTHYRALKALAQTRTGFINASVEFDVPTLSPTYRLMVGLPGGSSAIEIAGRLGMDASILDDARKLLHPEDRLLEQTLADLHETQRTLSQDRARARALREEAERASAEAAQIAERLRASEREEQRRIRQKLTDDLLRTRAELHALIDDLKRERTVRRATAAKQRVAEIAQHVEEALRPTETVPVDQLQPGGHVEIGRFGAVATLLESAKGKRRVRVRVGDREMSVEVSGLVGLPPGAQGRRGRRTMDPVLSAEPSASRPLQAQAATADAGLTDRRVDVRGASGDEAIERVIAALDRATLGGASSVSIIHGHGTGRLKSLVRSYLKTSHYVTGYRPGEPAEGGDGVTIALLK